MLSPGWVQALNEEEPKTEEYGVSTFASERRRPFSQKKFDEFAQYHFPESVIRTKSVIWFKESPDEAYVFEQSGQQIYATMTGKWIAAAPKELRDRFLRENPSQVWDETYGDRMIKPVIIGKNMHKENIIQEPDNCLTV